MAVADGGVLSHNISSLHIKSKTTITVTFISGAGPVCWAAVAYYLEMVESPEQTAVELESSQGDKTGYCSHNQAEGGHRVPMIIS